MTAHDATDEQERKEASRIHALLLRRQKICKELLDTERTYVGSLETLCKGKKIIFATKLFLLQNYFLLQKKNCFLCFWEINIFFFLILVFLEPLMKAAVYSKTPIISPEDVKSMFSIIEVITKINREFLGTLVNSVCYKKFSDIFFLHSEKKKKTRKLK